MEVKTHNQSVYPSNVQVPLTQLVHDYVMYIINICFYRFKLTQAVAKVTNASGKDIKH